MSDTPVTTPIRARRRYPDAPLVGVGVAVFDTAGRILLIRRGKPPRAGQWGLPGGLIDLGESLAAAAVREVREECGIEIDLGDLVAAFEPIQRDDAGAVEYHYVVLDYWAAHRSGDPVAHDDAADVAWVTLGELASYHLSADTMHVIHQAYQAWRCVATAPTHDV